MSAGRGAGREGAGAGQVCAEWAGGLVEILLFRVSCLLLAHLHGAVACMAFAASSPTWSASRWWK